MLFLEFLYEGVFQMEWNDLITNHVSVRAFENKKLPEEIKNQLIKAAQSGSSSNFLQAYSIIEVTDQQSLKRIEEISNCKGYIEETGAFYVFVADLYRHQTLLNQAGQSDEHLTTIESFVVSVVDTTIAAQNLAISAEAMDLGICYIGGIRNDLFTITELLQLPTLTYPLFGLSVGYPKIKNEVKPRLPQAEILSQNTYQLPNKELLKSYDQTMTDYYTARTANQQTTDWQSKILSYFSEPKRPETAEFLKKQGFRF
jgi:FMN reductase (NADPH)